jgi:hypothetical protein
MNFVCLPFTLSNRLLQFFNITITENVINSGFKIPSENMSVSEGSKRPFSPFIGVKEMDTTPKQAGFTTLFNSTF